MDPLDTLDNVVMCSYNLDRFQVLKSPNKYFLIVACRREDQFVVIQSQGSHSSVVSLVSLYVESTLHFSHPHSAISTGTQQEVSVSCELDRTHIMVVPVQSPDAFCLLKVP